MKPYADTNFFTRLYLDLPESAAADRALATALRGDSPPLPITWLHRLELINAFEFSVWLARQGGHPMVTPEKAAIAHASFRDDLAAETFLRPVRTEPSDHERHFEEIATRHTARHGFRSYDILHVSLALALRCDCFLTFDVRARKLAALEGLKVTV